MSEISNNSSASRTIAGQVLFALVIFSGSMEVIDLMDSQPYVEFDDDDNVNYFEDDGGNVIHLEDDNSLPRHIKKSVSRLIASFPFNTKREITKICQKYCQAHPNQFDINTIVKDCTKELESTHVVIDDSQVDESGEPSSTSTSSSNNGNSSSSGASRKRNEDDEVIMVEHIKLNPVQEVLKVLPNAKVTYIESLLEKFGNVVNDVVQDMLEKGYERETVKEVPADLDFTSTSWETSQLYRAQAQMELQSNFPYLQIKGLSKLFESHKHHYYPTYKTIMDLTGCAASYNLQTGLINHVFTAARMSELKEKLAPNPLLVTKVVAKKLSMPNTQSLDATLEKEIAWLRKKYATEREIEDKRIAEELNNQLAAAEGTAVECGCCCCEYAFDNMRQCSEGHLFCKTCLSKYIEQTIFGDGRSVIKCMSTEGDVCPGYFSDEMIRLSLSEKVFTKYSEQLARDALKAAKLDNLKTCYNCQLQCEINEDVGIVMTCPNCYKGTCISCGEEAHVPLKCSEVEKKGQTSKRLSVEEAMTQARVRQCPKCKTRFFKTEGCNKMTCTCGGLTCYVCRKDLAKEGYNHFCQTPHCDHKACNKCKLYSDSVEDDRLAMLEAGRKMLEEKGPDEEGANEGKGGSSSRNNNNEGPKIELEKLLEGGLKNLNKKGAAGPAAAAAAAAAAVGPRGMPVIPPLPMGGVFGMGGGLMFGLGGALVGGMGPPNVFAGVANAYAAMPQAGILRGGGYGGYGVPPPPPARGRRGGNKRQRL